MGVEKLVRQSWMKDVVKVDETTEGWYSSERRRKVVTARKRFQRGSGE
jgi:hypothetical protein